VRKEDAIGAYILDGGGVCDFYLLASAIEANKMCLRDKPYRSFSEHVDKYFDNTIFSYKVRFPKYAKLQNAFTF
jgi:hypothetical protein